jgi:hypothetical protein
MVGRRNGEGLELDPGGRKPWKRPVSLGQRGSSQEHSGDQGRYLLSSCLLWGAIRARRQLRRRGKASKRHGATATAGLAKAAQVLGELH